MQTIVIGVDHNNALGLIWSLYEAGHKVILILRQEEKSYIAKSRYISKLYRCVSDEELINKIIEISKSLPDKPVVFVSGDEDATLLNNYYSDLKPYCFIEGGRLDGSVNRYRDKNIGNELAEKCGFTLPRNCIIESEKQLNEISFDYPIVVKANNSVHGGKQAMKVCYDQKEAELFVSTLHNDFFPLQVQEFIEKEYEIMLLGCSLNGGKNVICPVANRKIRQFPRPMGLGSYCESISVQQYRTLRELAEKVTQYVRAIEYTGNFSAEFLYSKGKYYFLEVNLRNDGTSWLSTCSGYNLPDMVCRSFMNGEVNIDCCTFKSRHYMNMLAEVRSWRKGYLSFGQWLKGFNKNTCYSHYNKKDIKPFIYYVTYFVETIICNKIRKVL